MKTKFVRLIGFYFGSGAILMGLSSCALPRIDEEDPEIGLSAANMEGLAPEGELAEGALPSQAKPEFPEEILVAGPAYEGERKSPWDIPADEFVTLVERSVEKAGDESLLADGNYLAYASSLLSEKKMYPDAESTQEVASLNQGDEEVEDTSVVSDDGDGRWGKTSHDGFTASHRLRSGGGSEGGGNHRIRRGSPRNCDAGT